MNDCFWNEADSAQLRYMPSNYANMMYVFKGINYASILVMIGSDSMCPVLVSEFSFLIENLEVIKGFS